MGSNPIPSDNYFHLITYMEIKNYNQLDFKRINKKVNLIIPAQTAKLGPPVGPILGQVKIKVKDFCTEFNESSNKFKLGLPLPVSVFVYKNDSFDFYVKTPTTSFLLKNLLKFNNTKVLTSLDIYKISLIKHLDVPHLTLKSVYKTVLNSAKQLKIKIES